MIGRRLVALALLAASQFSETHAMDAPRPTPTIEEVGAASGLKLPPDAALVGVRQETGIDSLIEFRMTVASGAFEQFLAQNGLDPAAFHKRPGGLLGASHAFWTPAQEPELYVASYPRAPGRTLDVAVTPAIDGRRTVYVRAFSL